MATSRVKPKQGPQGGGDQRVPHERYFELCALATSGTLSDGEWSELRAHLSRCQHCQELLQKYREVARTGMPLLISEDALGDREGQDSWTPELARQELLARIAKGDETGWTQEEN